MVIIHDVSYLICRHTCTLLCKLGSKAGLFYHLGLHGFVEPLPLSIASNPIGLPVLSSDFSDDGGYTIARERGANLSKTWWPFRLGLNFRLLPLQFDNYSNSDLEGAVARLFRGAHQPCLQVSKWHRRRHMYTRDTVCSALLLNKVVGC